MKKKLVIAGGTGLLGSRLIELLDPNQYEIFILTRNANRKKQGVHFIEWDTESQTIEVGALKDSDIIINLAGAGIADKRWTKERKKIILHSRLNSVKTIARCLIEEDIHPKLYIGASAIGIYGHRGDEMLNEESGRGQGYLSDVTKEWEKVNKLLIPYFDKHILLRIGIVMSTKGGALKEILKSIKTGVYGYFGDGSAYYSWIHIDDMCGIIKYSMDDQLSSGVYNAVAPQAETIKNIMKSIKKVKGSIAPLVPVPKLALRMMLGEMSTMLTNSTRVLPARLEQAQYNFDHQDLHKALEHLMNEEI